ncbi:Tetratricopeptide repeat protein [compost metagenome]
MGEFERWRFMRPQDAREPRARLQLGRCYLQGKRYEQALAYFAPSYASAELEAIARYEQGRALLGLGRFEEAEAAIRPLEHSASLAAPARVQLGLMAAEQGAWQQAGDYFERAGASGATAIARSAQTRHAPSPWVAGGLSTLLPGAGQLYLGRQSDGFGSMLLTAALVGASYYYAQRDQAPLSYATGILGAGFWGASVYGAIGGARHEARLADAQAIRAIEAAIAPLVRPDLP